jgi:hypothetical protein
MQTDVINIARIIRDAGGASAIERASHERGGDLSRSAVYKWQSTGIPDRHWPIIMSLTEYGPVELYTANCAARDGDTHAREDAA